MSKFARNAFVVGGVLALVALVVWLVSGDPSGVGVQRIETTEEGESAAASLAVELTRTNELAQGGGARSEDEAADDGASPERAGTARTSVGANDAARAVDEAVEVPLFLTGEVVVVGGAEELPSDLHVVLALADGSILNATRDGKMYEVPLPAGAIEIRPFASGFDSRPIALNPDGLAARADERGRVRQDLVLWRAESTAIVVVGADGRSLTELARERGMEGRELFAYAFDIAVTAPLPDETRFGQGIDRKLGRLQKPEHREFEVASDVIALLDVASQTPVHVGLALHGVTVGWNVVERGAPETVFVLPSNVLEARVARLSLRALESAGGAAAPRVRVTLRAEKSPQRRPSQIDVPTDDEGRVVFNDVVPGEYELTLESDTALWSERVVLEPREQRDLGDIVLGVGGVIELHTVDALGAPLDAFVEVGPFGTELHVDELFPSHTHRQTKEGRYSLPAPARPTIVRVGVFEGRGSKQSVSSHVAVLDPRLGLPKELVLVLHTPIRFALTSVDKRAVFVLVRDSNGLIVDLRRPNADAQASNGLPPGSYAAELVDADGGILGRASFTLADGEAVQTIVL